VRRILSRPLQHYHGLTGSAADRRVAELLDLTRLPQEMIDRPVTKLSGGQKQRVNLPAPCRRSKSAAVRRGDQRLDTVVGAAILSLIEDLRRDLGLATVFISHDIHAVSSLCEQVLVLYGGTPVELATRAAFNGARHHPYTNLLKSSLPTMDPRWLDTTHAPILRGDRIAGLCPFQPRCAEAISGLCDNVPAPVREERECAGYAIIPQTWRNRCDLLAEF
jgi:peptide/nickel transport system ATP-binding protein